MTPPQPAAFSATDPTDNLAGWRYLANEAKAGRLVLDPSVASDCAAACDELIAGLQRVRYDVQFWNVDLGLGDFQCGHALSTLLRDAAVGDGGLHQRLGEHIQVVNLIRETITGQVRAIAGTDDHNASDLSNVVK